MSENSSFGEILENMLNEPDETPTQQEQPTNPTQPVKTDVEELIKFFSQYTTEKEARKALRGFISPTDKQRFFANGKSYSTGNGYKAIKRCIKQRLFKGEKPAQAEPKDLTYKMTAPPIPPRQEPEPTETETTDEEDSLSSIYNSDPQPIQEIEPEPQQQQPTYKPTQPSQPRQFNEPSARIVTSYTFIAKLMCNKLSQAFKDPELKAVLSMDDEEADQVGYAIAVLTVDESGNVDPRTAAVGVLITSVISRILPYAPKLIEKLKGKPKQ